MLTLLTIAIGVLGVIIALVAVWQRWWIPTSNRIKQALAEAEPTLSLTIGSYGGPQGEGYGMNLQNVGRVSAYNVSLFLPGIDGPAWQVAELPRAATPFEQIPIASDAAVRTQPMEGLTALLIYHDRFDRRFTASARLIQQLRADGRYNIATQDVTMTRPPRRFRDLWRLRKQV